jgi:hypothetical protein
MRALLGAVVGGALMVTGAIERGSALPFGVFLALGGVFTLFLGQDVWVGTCGSSGGPRWCSKGLTFRSARRPSASI